jgi:hypothetical protein
MATKKRHRTADLPPLVGVAEACAILGINRMSFKRWRDSGYFAIKPVQIGRDPVWAEADIIAFAAEKGRQRAPIGQTA